MAAKVVMKAVRMWNRRFCYAELGRIDNLRDGFATYDRDAVGKTREDDGGERHQHTDDPVMIISCATL